MAAAKLEDALKQCQKILNVMMAHKDANPFMEPVKWSEWGLTDYPKVIKHPMDLNKVNVSLHTAQARARLRSARAIFEGERRCALTRPLSSDPRTRAHARRKS